MRFHFVDRILELEPGVRITTVKALTLGEEYLADHFPRFPVMPGVLMLQAMTDAGAWLARATDEFSRCVVLLKEARNVRYADFVAPGQTLTIVAEVLKRDDCEMSLKARGTVGDRLAVSGRLTLERHRAANLGAGWRGCDAALERHMRQLFGMLYAKPASAMAEEMPRRSESAVVQDTVV